MHWNKLAKFVIDYPLLEILNQDSVFLEVMLWLKHKLILKNPVASILQQLRIILSDFIT